MSLAAKFERRAELARQLEKIYQEDPDLVREMAGSGITRPEKGVGEAILEFLKENGPSTSGQIRDGIEFRTKSDSKEKVIHSTLSTFKKNGTVKASRGEGRNLVYSV